MTAWLDYDPNTGMLRRVSWQAIPGETIEINQDMAEEFITGHKNFSNYIITGLPNTPTLSAINTKRTAPKNFWNLISLADSELMQKTITIYNDCVVIAPNDNDFDCILYMTKKDDPSWLISSWIISKTLIMSGSIKLSIPLAKSYSYFIGV